jgi:hypothetical protein
MGVRVGTNREIPISTLIQNPNPNPDAPPNPNPAPNEGGNAPPPSPENAERIRVVGEFNTYLTRLSLPPSITISQNPVRMPQRDGGEPAVTMMHEVRFNTADLNNPAADRNLSAELRAKHQALANALTQPNGVLRTSSPALFPPPINANGLNSTLLNPADLQRMLTAMRTVAPAPEQANAPENGPVISNVINGTRPNLALILNPKQAAERRAALEREIKSAQNRLGLAPQQYHNRVIMQGNAQETDQHFCRALLSAPSNDEKTLVIMTGGNNERLTQARDPRGSLRGQTYMFDRFAQDNVANTDVLQFRSGFLTCEDPAQQNSVASIHIQNIVNDALRGLGQFAGRRYGRVRLYGYSYGGGHTLALAEQLEQRRVKGERVPQIDRTALVDPIRFQSVPPNAVRSQPNINGNRHFHAYQNTDMILRGNSLVGAPGPNTVQRQINSNHQDINDAHAAHQRAMFDDIYQHLRS